MGTAACRCALLYIQYTPVNRFCQETLPILTNFSYYAIITHIFKYIRLLARMFYAKNAYKRLCHRCKIIYSTPLSRAGLLQNRYDYCKSVTAFFRVFLKKLRFLVKSVHIRRKINLKFVGAVH